MCDCHVVIKRYLFTYLMSLKYVYLAKPVDFITAGRQIDLTKSTIDLNDDRTVTYTETSELI